MKNFNIWKFKKWTEIDSYFYFIMFSHKRWKYSVFHRILYLISIQRCLKNCLLRTTLYQKILSTNRLQCCSNHLDFKENNVHYAHNFKFNTIWITMNKVFKINSEDGWSSYHCFTNYHKQYYWNNLGTNFVRYKIMNEL